MIKADNSSSDEHAGVHLYHAAMSNCSQRVRIILEEKNIEWVSHLLDLATDEQLDEKYQLINPKGVVPTLVHDGKIITESNDIIYYVNNAFPGKDFTENGHQCEQAESDLLTASASIQDAIKLITFTYIFGDRLRKSPQELSEYSKKQNNKELVAWHTKFSNREFSDAEIATAVTQFKNELKQINSILSDQHWLSGDNFGLADISWVVNAHRAVLLDRMHSGLTGINDLSQLKKWYSEVVKRPSFQKAVVDYEFRPG